MLTLNGSEIDARTPYAAKDIVKAVPGGRWVPADKVWRFPASPYCSKQLVEALGQWGVSDEVHEIASKWITVNEIIARINDGETVEVSELMRYQPRSNQVVGAMMGRLMQGFILGWGMGAGKTYGTLSCIADEIDRFLATDRQGPIPMFFISAPATVVQGVWPGEVKKHLVGWRDYLEVSALKKGSSTAQRLKDASRRLKWAGRDRKAFLFVCGHEASWRETISNFIKAHEWDIAAIDEIHRVETPGAKITRWVDTVLAPRARRRIGLTGTLFRKDELDAFCPVRFVEPGVFGRSADWAEHELFNDAQGQDDNLPFLERVPDNARPSEEQKRDDRPKFRVLYAGNLGRIHPIQSVVDAAQFLKEHDDIELCFVGDGPNYDRLAKERDKRGLDNMRFLPYQPINRLRNVLQTGDVHMIAIPPRIWASATA